jgi:hypothetical protein
MSQDRFRQLMLGFALLLGLQGLWIVIPESFSSGAAQLPGDETAATQMTLRRPKARWAASLGIVRGDLWADVALTYSELIWSTNPDVNQQRARSVIERALTYSPHRSDLWLLFALLSYRFDWNQSQLSSALKMSYYTGANEPDLVSLRIFAAVSSPSLDDIELQEMLRHDIRIIITRRPDLKPTIIAAYKSASMANKKFIEMVISEVDPQFLAAIVAH